MKDAFGGILNLVLVSVFLVIVSGILGFGVNYIKTFRMKNVVISAIEQYEGAGCFDTTRGDTGCLTKIDEGARSIGYHPVKVSCPKDYTRVADYFCYDEKDGSYKGSNPNAIRGKYYSIVTQVDINIPIVKNIMGLSFFQVHGDTRIIKK